MCVFTASCPPRPAPAPGPGPDPGPKTCSTSCSRKFPTLRASTMPKPYPASKCGTSPMPRPAVGPSPDLGPKPCSTPCSRSFLTLRAPPGPNCGSSPKSRPPCGPSPEAGPKPCPTPRSRPSPVPKPSTMLTPAQGPHCDANMTSAFGTNPDPGTSMSPGPGSTTSVTPAPSQVPSPGPSPSLPLKPAPMTSFSPSPDSMPPRPAPKTNVSPNPAPNLRCSPNPCTDSSLQHKPGLAPRPVAAAPVPNPNASPSHDLNPWPPLIYLQDPRLRPSTQPGPAATSAETFRLLSRPGPDPRPRVDTTQNQGATSSPMHFNYAPVVCPAVHPSHVPNPSTSPSIGSPCQPLTILQDPRLRPNAEQGQTPISTDMFALLSSPGPDTCPRVNPSPVLQKSVSPCCNPDLGPTPSPGPTQGPNSAPGPYQTPRPCPAPRPQPRPTLGPFARAFRAARQKLRPFTDESSGEIDWRRIPGFVDGLYGNNEDVYGE